MTASLEFEEKNIDKAVERASQELNMPKEDLKYEVLSYGSSGIFGLAGAKKAKIRVQLPEEVLPSEPKLVTSEFDANPADGLGNPKASDALDLDDEFAGAEKDPQSPGLYAFPDDPVDLGRHVLQRIIDAITTDAEISVEEDSDRVFFNVAGGNAGILIGKRGQTLDAIQSIVEKVVNKHNQNRIRVMVDVQGYLKSRQENLEILAVRLAEKAKRIGKPISLGHMNAYDRRIAHIALKDDPDVKTSSRGEGPLRKLVIFPKKRSFPRR
jgi:spoIIIJ-associated protein